MHFHIMDMATLLYRNKLIGSDQVLKAEKVLEEYWKDKAAVIWSIVDVYQAAADKGITLRLADAYEVLDMISDRHDASLGVNWDVISVYIDEVVGHGKRST